MFVGGAENPLAMYFDGEPNDDGTEDMVEPEAGEIERAPMAGQLSDEDFEAFLKASTLEDRIAKVKSDKSTEGVESKSEVEVSIIDDVEILNKFSAFENEATEMEASITELEGEKETLTQEIERLTALLGKANARGTEISTDGDPAVIAENKVESSEVSFWNSLANKIKN